MPRQCRRLSDEEGKDVSVAPAKIAQSEARRAGLALPEMKKRGADLQPAPSWDRDGGARQVVWVTGERQQTCPNQARTISIQGTTIAGLIAPSGRMLSSEEDGRMGERVRGLVYEAAVITGGMAPVALLALALMLD